MKQNELVSLLIGLTLAIDRLRITGKTRRFFGKKSKEFSVENLNAIIEKLEAIRTELCTLIPESEVEV
jgi:hypothetical protein